MALISNAKRALELLREEGESPHAIADRLGASPEAVDEARCLLEEIQEAEVDAILAMPTLLARALLRAAVEAGRHGILGEAAVHGEKEIQKEAKRLAHQLRLRGVEVELPGKDAEVLAQREAPSGPELPAMLSAIDPEGNRAFLWTRQLPGRGIELADIVCSEDGVREFHLGEISRKKLRELVKELAESRPPLVVITREEGKRFLDRIRIAVRDGGKSPRDFLPWAIHALGPIPEEAPPPLAPLGDGAAPENPEDVARLAEESASLLSERELMGWYPDEAVLKRLSIRVDEARSSPLYLPGEQGEAQRDEAIVAAADREAERTFDDGEREKFGLWLLEAARLFELQGKIHQARVASAASILLRRGAPLAEVPFGYEYMRRLIRRPARPKQEEPPSGSPIILP